MIKRLAAFKFLVIAGLVLTAASLSNPIMVKDSHEPPGFCDEVAHELNLAFLDGRMDAEDANRIIERCFELHS